MVQRKRGKSGRAPIALVTGAAAGLGFELSKLYAEAGYGLVLVDSDTGRLQSTADRLKNRYGVAVTPIAQDLGDTGAPDRISRELTGSGLTPDVIITREGFRVYGPFPKADFQKELHPVCRDYQ
ncbi:MAG: SDR family NAD(P)-dependent oxidoreductase [Desulfobacterales bacterium]|nr:SDR family NAD(P)-dependent oxidoreductase [Desulfobacterales bacterium]